ncbi:MAG: hypothetical protein ABGX16_08540, partial [Pirellulales bacterium]
VHGFCYRFYNARFGSFPTQEDRKMIAKYPHTNAPLSLSLVAEAAFEPNASTERRRHKLKRLKKLAIPDYPPKKQRKAGA